MGWFDKPVAGMVVIAQVTPFQHDMTQVNLVQLDQVSVQFTCNVSPFNSSSDHWVVSLYNNDTFSGRMIMRSKKNNQGKLLVKLNYLVVPLY